MKFLEFAVHQKLERDNSLLDYVANNKPVPCDILEDSLESLITPLADERASALVNDFAHMMQTYIPVTYQTGEDDTYTVQGDIPDNVLDSIELVHGVNANDAIKAMIAANEDTLQQHSTVTNVTLLKSAERLLATPLPSIHQEIPITYPLPPTENSRHETIDVHHMPKQNNNTDEHLEDVMSEVEQGQNEARETMMRNEMDINDVYNVPSIEDAQATRAPLADTLQDIYQTMIRSIKQAGLDTALGLQL